MKKLNKFYIPYLIFITILIAGIQIYKDYGVSSDELNNRLKGTISLNYVGEQIFPKYLENYKKNFSKKNNKIYNIKNLHEAGLIKYYGVTFDLPLYALELFLGINEVNKKYELRHLATFILFFVSLIFFYKLIKLRTGSSLISSTSVLILFLTPRIFANSFYNSKDMVFLSFFIIAIYYSSKFLKKQNNKNIVLASLFCALTIDTRIAGIIIPFFLLFIFFIETLIAGKKLKFLALSKYFSLLILFIIFFWPFLWQNPLKNFVEAYIVVSKYPINFEFLFNGSFISTSSVPFYYHVQWILISLPVINIFLFFLGIFFFIFDFKTNYRKFYPNFIQDLFVFLILFSVIFLTVFLNITSYDGWRHFYFIYPLIIFFSICAINRILLFNNTKTKYLIIFFVFTSIIYNLFWIVKNHPHQNVYFNFLAGKNLTNKFQMDYWGLSYKQNLEIMFLSETDNKEIKVHNLSSNKLFYHSLSLKDKLRDRIKIVSDIEDADYVVDNFNYREKPNLFYLEKYFETLNEIVVDGNKINVLYKRKINF